MRLIDADALMSEIDSRLEYISQRRKRLANHLHLFMTDSARMDELHRLKALIKYNDAYCPNCGAKMDGGAEDV